MMNLLAKQVGPEKTEKIVKGELKGVLEQCIKKTKASTKAKITKRFQLKGSVKAFMDAEIPHNGIDYPQQTDDLKAQITFEGNRKFKLPSDLNASNFARVKRRLAITKNRKLKNIGLAKSTFLFVAKEAGILQHVSGDKKAQDAYSNNKEYGRKVVAVKESGSGSTYSLTFEITSATVYNGTGGVRVVQKAIEGREKFFAKNVKLGVFEEPEKFADAYGFLFS